MSYTNRDAILSRLRLAERDEESLPLGGTLRLTELTRAQLREATAWSARADLAERERERGQALADATQGALASDHPDDALRRALTNYYLGAPETATDADRFNAAIFASGVIDPETKAPLFRREELILWPSRGVLWREVLRIAQAILNLSEVGSAALKSGDPTPAAE